MELLRSDDRKSNAFDRRNIFIQTNRRIQTITFCQYRVYNGWRSSWKKTRCFESPCTSEESGKIRGYSPTYYFIRWFIYLYVMYDIYTLVSIWYVSKWRKFAKISDDRRTDIKHNITYFTCNGFGRRVCRLGFSPILENLTTQRADFWPRSRPCTLSLET